MIKKLSSNILIYGLTNGIKSLVPFFMLPILTTYLSIEQYGTLSIIEITILFLSPFIILNINSSINVEFFKKSKNELKDYITNALVISFVSFLFLFLLFILFAPLISTSLKIESTLIIWLPVFVLLRITPQVLLGIFQISNQAKKFSLFTIFQTIIDFGLSYIFIVIYHLGYIGRIDGTYISFGLASLIGLYLLHNMDYIGKITLKYSKDILKFGIPLIPHALGSTIMTMSDRYFISYYIGNTEVGLYTVAYQVSALMLLVGMSINQAWIPLLYNLLKSNDKMKYIIKYSLGLSLLFFIVGLTLLLSKELLFNFLISYKFYQAIEFFPWLLLGFVFQSFYFLVTNFLFFEKKTTLLAKITFSGATLNIILNFLFIQKFGTIGVAYATAITWFLFFLFVLFFTLRFYYKKRKYIS